MSRGIGKTQQRILDELAGEIPTASALFVDGGFLTVIELAERIGTGDRQMRRAVRSLEERGLVIITRGTTWHGIGEYGPMMPRQWSMIFDTDNIPTAKVVKAGDDWPWNDHSIATRDTELIHIGIPSPELRVWLPQNRISYLKLGIDLAKRWGGPGNAEERDEYERLTATAADKHQLPA